ncbi:SIS domain-containing protein [Paenibacillus sp. S150]|uniref:SIS domain-containing protein n=1 Tax=Paenibacillus sp. S150 TaxID=2749826 RepID=UPI001C56B32B|nr:SIS domain-containing protein [Paenibacillus sp. S150]MBW4083099.1 SIS domain-containing protein [Paenibacillus sp. S150]
MSIDALVADIREQPAYLYKHIAMIEQVIETVKKIDLSGGYVFTGIATSYYSLQAMEMWLRKRGQFKGQLINTADLLDYDLPLHQDMRPLFIMSRSGESAEILRLIRSIAPSRTVIAITENANSPLVQRADYLCRFEANEEAFTNTKSFTLSLTYALAIGIGLGYEFALKPSEWIAALVTALNDVMKQWSNAERIAAMLLDKQSILIEAQGYLTGIANQASLDFQEIQVPSIPVTGGALRHGTIELTARPDVAVLILAPLDETLERKVELINDLHDDHTPVAAVLSDRVQLEAGIPAVYVPELCEELQPVMYAFVMHMIYSSYAILKGMTTVQPSLVNKVTRKE